MGGGSDEEVDNRRSKGKSMPLLEMAVGWLNNLLPNLDKVVTAARCKSFDVIWFLAGWLIDKASWYNSRGPAHSIAANLCNEKIM